MSLTFKKKCLFLRDLSMLSEDELWAQNNPDVMEMVRAYNLGIPLAFCIHFGIVEATAEAEDLIDEAFEAFVEVSGKTLKELSEIDSIGEIPGFRHP